jgi:hypothetical protein
MGLVEGVKDAVGGVVCAGLGNAGWVAGLLSGAGLPADGIEQAIHNQIAIGCGSAPENLPSVGEQPQFSGGQCEDATYRVEVRNADPQPGQSFISSFYDILGPLSGLEIRKNKNNIDVWGMPVKARPEFSQYADGFYGMVAANSVNGLEIERIYRLDGQPDDCGDLPAQPPPPISEHDDTLPPIAYPDKDGNPINLPDLPIKFFKPCINLDGIRIPFEIDAGFTKICGKAGIGFDIADFDISPNIDIDVCPSQKENLNIPQESIENFFDLELIGTDSSDPQLSGQLSSQAERETPILGVFIRARKVSENVAATIVGGSGAGGPALLIPSIGEVIFECQALEEDGFRSGFYEPIAIKNVQAFVPCPWPFGATSVSVIFRSGWEGSYYVARRKTCCDACKNNDPNAGLDNWDRCRID